MEMETQQPLKLQDIYPHNGGSYYHRLAADKGSTQNDIKTLCYRQCAALTRRMFRAEQLKTLSTLCAAAAAACLGDCHPKVENADGWYIDTRHPETSNQQPVTSNQAGDGRGTLTWLTLSRGQAAGSIY